MNGRSTDAAGFSLVEVIIAMVLLGLVALAMLPALVNGLRYSNEQADVASATRLLNAVVEQARATPSCTELNAIVADTRYRDGERVLTGAYDVETKAVSFSCTPGGINVLELTAVTASGDVLATVYAKVLASG